jgi:hypothetical protein
LWDAGSADLHALIERFSACAGRWLSTTRRGAMMGSAASLKIGASPWTRFRSSPSLITQVGFVPALIIL